MDTKYITNNKHYTDSHKYFRVNHTERDLAQKRTLMEDIRLKLKIAEENATSDASVLVSIFSIKLMFTF